MFSKLFAFALAVTSVAAEAVPGYGGYGVVWQENFNGPAGSLVNEGNWNIIVSAQNANNEWEQYTRSNSTYFQGSRFPVNNLEATRSLNIHLHSRLLLHAPLFYFVFRLEQP